MNQVGAGTRLLVFARSLLVLAVLAIGVPTALLFAAQERFGGGSPFAGVPAPSSWSLDRIGSALSDRLTDRTIADIVIRVSLVVAWVAVIVIVLTVAAELAHMVRHDGLALPDVPGFGVSQRTARMVASGLLVIIPLFTSPASAVARTGSTLVPEPRAPATTVAGGEGSAGPLPTVGAVRSAWSAGDSLAAAPSERPEVAGEYVVRAGDSVFGIAERLAGPEPAAVDAYAGALIDANLGRRMPDGRTFDNAAFLDVGWMLELPPLPSSAETDAEPPVVDDVHVVERGESLWSIADDELGDPLRWPEVFGANEGRTFDDGEMLSDPDLIQPGWDIVIPTAASGADDAGETTPEIVVDGEVVAEITHVESHREAPIAPAVITHVDPHPEIPTPVGSDTSADDDFQSPGETSVAVTGMAPSRQDNIWDGAEQGGSIEGRVHDIGDVADDTPELSSVDLAEPANGDADTRADDGAAGEPDAPSTGVDDVAAGRVSSSTVDEDPMPTPPADRESDAPALLTLGRAAMLSAGVLTLLAVRRRNQLRRARPRSRIPEPAPGPAATERILRSIDSGERFARVDIATRAVALSLIERERRVLAVSVAADGALELRTTGPVDLCAPWEGADSTWVLAASVPLELLADDARRVGAPCPTLVQLGTDETGRDVYVDLEALEAVEVGGPGALADAIVAALAATLAGSILAEVSTLVGLGVADDAFLGHRNYVPVRDPQRAFEAASDAIGSTASMSRSTFELRARGTSGETWEPAVVLAGAAAGTISAPSNRTGLALVSASPIHGPSSRLAPDGDAWLLMPAGIRLTPVGLNPDDLASIAQLVTIGDHTTVDPAAEGFPIRFDDARVGEMPGVDAVGSSVASTDDNGAVENEMAGGHRLRGAELDDDHTVVDPTDNGFPIRFDDAVGRGVVPVVDVGGAEIHSSAGGRSGEASPAEVGHDAVIRRDDDGDAGLEDGVGVDGLEMPRDGVVRDDFAEADSRILDVRADRHVSTSSSRAMSPRHELLVRLLGAVEVVDLHGAPVEFERSKTRELVAWLATHRERSTRSAARTALWELDVRDATFANVVSEARRALARLTEPPPGDEWVGRTNTEALPLHGLVRTDADLVRHALDAARVQPPAQAIATLVPAVDLITGMPFAGTSYLWPDSEGITSNLVLLATTATTELAAHCLSIGDIEGVFGATGRGLRVLPGHEELIGLRMEAHARAGDHAGVRQEWESYERVINGDPWSDGEPALKLVELRRRLLNPSR